MKRLLCSLVLGVAAGIVDVLPMVALGTDRFASVSAFTHWVLLGYLICYVQLNLRSWLRGMVIAGVSAIPVALMVYPVDPSALLPITAMSIVLGSAVGAAAGRLGILERQTV